MYYKMKKNIAILGGGNSSESEISIQSAKQIQSVLSKDKYNSYTIIIQGTRWIAQHNNKEFAINKDDFSIEIDGEKINFDCALNTIHGTPGEDGLLSSYFELLNIPHTASNTFTSALTFNKYAAKAYLLNTDILMAKSILLRPNDEINTAKIISELSLPCFVKPNAGGSSFGISKVKVQSELTNAIQEAFNESNEVIIEEFIEGFELTNGVLKTKKQEYVLPITEIKTKNDFFDYNAKYTGESQEITPAEIHKDLEIKVKNLSSKIYDIFNCSGVVRIDYIIKNNEPYFIEINTIPGMSEASIIPQQARAMGISVSELFSIIIDDL